MIEFFFILSQFFIIFFISSFNIFALIDNNKNQYNLSLPDNVALSIIVYLNLILFISFFNLSLMNIIFCYFIYLLILIFVYFYRYKKVIFLKNNYFFYFILLFSTSSILFIEVANNLILGWDVQKFWIYKTLNFFNGNSIANLPELPNPWYPYLGSLAWSFFWKLSLIEYEYSGRLYYVFIYLSSLLLVIKNLELSKINKFLIFIFLLFYHMITLIILIGASFRDTKKY